MKFAQKVLKEKPSLLRSEAPGNQSRKAGKIKIK
jgi:hypothetical protein